MSCDAGNRAWSVTEKVTSLLNEFGIRVPEDVEAEVYELIEREYKDVEELAWMYEDLTS